MSEPSTPATPAPPLTPPAPRSLSRRKKWFFRIAALTLIPALTFTLLELGLRAGGYGQSTRFFLDGSKLERPGYSIDNRKFGQWVFPRGIDQPPFPVPFSIKDDKPANVFRVFVLGESAAMGFPEPSISFPRVLEVLLRARSPGTRFEVVNASVVAINSHVVLPIARECCDHKPDLLVVHLGNNEVVGPFGAAGVLGDYAQSRTAVQWNLAIRRTRTGQLLDSFTSSVRGGGEKKTWKGMEMFVDRQVRADDPKLARIRDHYRRNLEDICQAGTDARVPVVVCTIPVNLKDCSPFGSLHTTDLSAERTASWDSAYNDGVRLQNEKKYTEALARYLDAQQIDDQFAELAFREGHCLLALNRPAEARLRFARACDLDTLRFRSDSEINRTIREVVNARSGSRVQLADAETAFAEASPGGIAGEELFLEHVHMNFTGNYLLARTVYQSIVPSLDARFSPGPTTPPTEQECASRLAYTDWNKLKMASEVRNRLLRQPPFTGQYDRAERDVRWDAKIQELEPRLGGDGMQRMVREYQQAITATDDDWMLRMNFGQLLMQTGDQSGAEEQYAAAVSIMKHNYAARLKLGQILLQAGRVEAAAKQFEEVIRYAPDWPDGHLGFAETLGAKGKVDEGLAIYEKWLEKAPTRATGLMAISAYLLRAGRTEEAKRRLHEAAEADPTDGSPYAQLGDIALRDGKKDEALAMYERALQRRPDWPEMKAHVDKIKSGAAK